MAIKFTQLRCPNCGASLEIESSRSEAFCTYCGTKILVTDENKHEYNYTYRTIDEARIAEARYKNEMDAREAKQFKWTMIGLGVMILIFILIPIIFL